MGCRSAGNEEPSRTGAAAGCWRTSSDGHSCWAVAPAHGSLRHQSMPGNTSSAVLSSCRPGWVARPDWPKLMSPAGHCSAE